MFDVSSILGAREWIHLGEYIEGTYCGGNLNLKIEKPVMFVIIIHEISLNLKTSSENKVESRYDEGTKRPT